MRRIYEAMLTQSPQIRESNFRLIGTDDLERLFVWYDREFFRGRLGEMVLEDEAHPVAFRLSRRLVSAAGQTVRHVRRRQRDGKPAVRIDYEITVSATLLFNTFHDVERTVTVGGRICRDRLEALQRIFEHELLHLAEFLGWGRSNCRADNFHALSRRIFAHEGAFHDLITPREAARAAFDIRVGDHVSFEVDGERHRGRVNRITRRATVLVEHPRGKLYSDDRRYIPFYMFRWLSCRRRVTLADHRARYHHGNWRTGAANFPGASRGRLVNIGKTLFFTGGPCHGIDAQAIAR